MIARLLQVAVLSLVALVLPPRAVAQHPDYSDLDVHARGLGPAELGMKMSRVSEVLDIDLGEDAIRYTDADCSSYALGASPYEWDLRFIAQDNKLVKIDILTDRVLTETGVGVGSAASSIRQAYDSDFRVLPGRARGESTLQTRTEADTVLAFIGRRPGPAQQGGAGGRAPPEVVRRYSVGLPESDVTEGCL